MTSSVRSSTFMSVRNVRQPRRSEHASDEGTPVVQVDPVQQCPPCLRRRLHQLLDCHVVRNLGTAQCQPSGRALFEIGWSDAHADSNQ